MENKITKIIVFLLSLILLTQIVFSAPPQRVCGDFQCQDPETCSTCPEDCGACPSGDGSGSSDDANKGSGGTQSGSGAGFDTATAQATAGPSIDHGVTCEESWICGDWSECFVNSTDACSYH